MSYATSSLIPDSLVTPKKPHTREGSRSPFFPPSSAGNPSWTSCRCGLASWGGENHTHTEARTHTHTHNSTPHHVSFWLISLDRKLPLCLFRAYVPYCVGTIPGQESGWVTPRLHFFLALLGLGGPCLVMCRADSELGVQGFFLGKWNPGQQLFYFSRAPAAFGMIGC